MKPTRDTVQYAHRPSVLGMFTLLLVLSALLCAADVQSQRSGNWSDSNTWSNGRVPQQGDNVLVDSSHLVIYNVHSDVEIRSIHIRGKLEFARYMDTRLDVGMIVLTTDRTVDLTRDCSIRQNGPIWNDVPQPTLEVGTMDNPIPDNNTALIRLVHFSDLDPDCSPGIMSYGGRMDFHGAPLNRTWVKMARSAMDGANTVQVAEPVNWRVGDRIIITRTERPGGNIVSLNSYRSNGLQQTEERIIAAISGTTITLDRALDHDHPKFGPYAGEVANLSRNVIVESKDPGGVRGHTMYHYKSLGSISYAEFRHLGKDGRLARYPIHFHVMRATNRGSSVVGASIWDSHNRWVTVHATDYMVVRDCVGYKSRGHGFFLEDATEAYNLFANNLAVLAYEHDRLPNQALPFDANDGAGFWWTNGRNAFINNTAAECDVYGFSYEVRDDVVKPMLRPDGTMENGVTIKEVPFLRFAGNEVHGTLKYGVRTEEGHAAVDRAFVMENTTIWNLWYGIRMANRNYHINGLNLRNMAYGFYGQEVKDGRVENFHANDPGNMAIYANQEPEGLITFENVTIDSCNNYPFQIVGKDSRPRSCEIHVRNLSMNHVNNGNTGATSGNGAESNPDLTLFLHDYYGPNQDAVVIPDVQSRNDGRNYQTRYPEFNNDVKVATDNVPWPNNPVHFVDDLPPGTVITYPHQGMTFPSGTQQVTVIGACVDNSNITSLTVNGVEATPLEDNYLTWQVTLTNLSDGVLNLRARAIDEFGNVEQNPHNLNIGIGTANVTGIGDDDGSQYDPALVVDGFELQGNYPNPFNPETRIRFRVAGQYGYGSEVTITIYNVLGRAVRTLVSESLAPGEYERTWDARDEQGNPVASGMYIYTMTARNGESGATFSDSRKMLLVR